MPDRAHIVSRYDEELAELDRLIAKMGGLTERLLADAMQALIKRSPELATEVIGKDKEIDRLEREIEMHCVTTIAKRQPLAQDLRHLIAGMRIATDLERIGDLGKNLAKRTIAVVQERQPQELARGFEHIGELAMLQLKDVLDAYAKQNVELAMSVWRRDEEIDSMYNSLFRELLTYMMEDPRNIGLCTHLLFGAKNIERIGDHTTNIAETICYMIRGEMIEEPRPKMDYTSSTSIHEDQLTTHKLPN